MKNPIYNAYRNYKDQQAEKKLESETRKNTENNESQNDKILNARQDADTLQRKGFSKGNIKKLKSKVGQLDDESKRALDDIESAVKY